MSEVAHRAGLKAQRIRENLGFTPMKQKVRYVKPEVKRVFRCVDGAIFMLNEADGEVWSSWKLDESRKVRSRSTEENLFSVLERNKRNG